MVAVRRAPHPADKVRAIVQDLTAPILSGEWPPGTRLPRWRELVQQYGTTMATVSKAMTRLSDAGFITRTGGAAPVVAEYPPHQYHVGLVFPQKLEVAPGQPRSRFWQALAQVATTPGAFAPRWFSLYTEVYHQAQADTERLEADLALQRVAGLIFAEVYPLFESPLARLRETQALPLVSLMARRDPQVGAVVLQHHSLFERGLEWLSRTGCRRVAVVSLDWMGESYINLIRRELAAVALPVRPGWVGGFNPLHPEWVGEWVALLLDRPEAEQPDGFLVTDEHLTQALAAALVRCGRPPGPELPVVSHCNFPLPTENLPAGITWLGFDLRELLAECCRELDRQRAGQPPGGVELPAKFHAELTC